MQGKKIPEDFWERFLKLLCSNIGSVAHVCKEMDISRRSYYNKRLQDPAFARKADRIFERIHVPIAEEILRNLVLGGHWQAVRYTLDRGSSKWNPKLSEGNIVELEGVIGWVEQKIIEENERKSKATDKKLEPPKDEEAEGKEEKPAF